MAGQGGQGLGKAFDEPRAVGHRTWGGRLGSEQLLVGGEKSLLGVHQRVPVRVRVVRVDLEHRHFRAGGVVVRLGSCQTVKVVPKGSLLPGVQESEQVVERTIFEHDHHDVVDGVQRSHGCSRSDTVQAVAKCSGVGAPAIQACQRPPEGPLTSGGSGI